MEEGRVQTIEEIEGLCKKLVDPSMTLCPGISVEDYESYKIIKYDQKMCILPLIHLPTLSQ